MNFLNTLFRFYINSSIHVALAVYALLRVTELYFRLRYNEPLDYFVFYGTITGYNFVKYAGIAKLHHVSLTQNLKLIQVFSLICFGLMFFYVTQLELKTMLFFLPFGVLTLLYAVPFLKAFSKNLRNIGSLKIIIIALVWTGVTAIIPLIDNPDIDSTKIILYSIQRFLLVIVLTLPFDIRDLQFDKRKLQTIPQVLGVERTKKLGFVLLALTMLIEFFVTPNQSVKVIYILVFLILTFLLQRAKRKQSAYYASFWVESLPILWWVLLILKS